MKSRSKRNKIGADRVNQTGQTGQTGRTTGSKRAAKPAKSVKAPRVVLDLDKESLSAGEAARELGISPRTLRRLCSVGQLPSFRTPGGQVRVWRNHIDAYLQGVPSKVAVLSSSALENKREALQNLTLELQERRLRRDLKKINDEDTEAENEHAASIEAEELSNRVALEEVRLQRERRAEERQREQEQVAAERQWQQWVDSWLDYALKSLPRGVPTAVVLHVQHVVEEALSNIALTRPRNIVERLVAGAVERGLGPWRRQQEIEQAVKDARKELPMVVQNFSDWCSPTEWEVRAMSTARDAIARLVPDASLAEVRAVSMQAGRRVAMEYEAEQDRVRREQQRQRLVANKPFLISLGVAEVGSYLKKLHLDDEIFDEDLGRKAELERAVRSALEGRLTGEESLYDAMRIAREVVDAEVNS